jgi:hypothetical protein
MCWGIWSSGRGLGRKQTNGRVRALTEYKHIAQGLIPIRPSGRATCRLHYQPLGTARTGSQRLPARRDRGCQFTASLLMLRSLSQRSYLTRP